MYDVWQDYSYLRWYLSDHEIVQSSQWMNHYLIEHLTDQGISWIMSLEDVLYRLLGLLDLLIEPLVMMH